MAAEYTQTGETENSRKANNPWERSSPWLLKGIQFLLGLCTLMGGFTLWPKVTLTPSANGLIATPNPTLITFSLSNESHVNLHDVSFGCTYPLVSTMEQEVKEIDWQTSRQGTEAPIKAGDSYTFRCPEFVRADSSRYTVMERVVLDPSWRWSKSGTLWLQVNDHQATIKLENETNNIFGVRDAINQLKFPVEAEIQVVEMNLGAKTVRLPFLTLFTNDPAATVELRDGSQNLTPNKYKTIEHDTIDEIRTAIALRYRYGWLPWHFEQLYYFRTKRGPDDRYYFYTIPKIELEHAIKREDLPQFRQEDSVELGARAFHSGDYHTALSEWTVLAQDGNPRAQYGMGVLLYRGLGVKRNFAEAVKWFRLAAQQGDTQAEAQLGKAYYFGVGVDRDLSVAVYWLGRAATKDDPDAQYILGAMYLNGEGLTKEVSAGVTLLEKSARHEFPGAAVILGHAYLNGNFVTKNFGKAKEYLDIAAANGEEAAQYDLARIYFDGLGIVRNIQEAVKWYGRAADQGYVPAQYVLAQIFSNQNYKFECSCSNRMVEAYVWAAVATANGSTKAESLRAELASKMNDKLLKAAMERAHNWSPHREQDSFDMGYNPWRLIGAWPDIP